VEEKFKHERKLNKQILSKLMNLRTQRMLDIIGYKPSEVESRRLQYAMLNFQSVGARLNALKRENEFNNPGSKQSIRELLGMDFDVEGSIEQFSSSIPNMEDDLDKIKNEVDNLVENVMRMHSHQK